MTYLIEQLINGICQGAIYALFAIGYTIIVGVVGLVSFTFGEVIMIGAFAALFTATLTGGNILLTILFSFAASGLIGIVIHKICYEKFFESARYIPLICTIGMSMLIKSHAGGHPLGRHTNRELSYHLCAMHCYGGCDCAVHPALDFPEQNQAGRYPACSQPGPQGSGYGRH